MQPVFSAGIATGTSRKEERKDTAAEIKGNQKTSAPLVSTM